MIDKITQPKDSCSKNEIELLQQKQHEYTLLGHQKKMPGHTLFSINTLTGQIKEAEIETSVVFNPRSLLPSYKSRVVIEKNCIYLQALNKKNLLKKLRRKLEQLKINES